MCVRILVGKRNKQEADVEVNSKLSGSCVESGSNASYKEFQHTFTYVHRAHTKPHPKPTRALHRLSGPLPVSGLQNIAGEVTAPAAYQEDTQQSNRRHSCKGVEVLVHREWLVLQCWNLSGGAWEELVNQKTLCMLGRQNDTCMCVSKQGIQKEDGFP